MSGKARNLLLIIGMYSMINSIQAQQNFCVDVSMNLHTFKDEDTSGNYKYYTKGNCFFIWGTVYPGGTFDTHGVTSGMLLDGTPEWPDLVLGFMNSRGWVLQDESVATTGRLALTKHILVIEKDIMGLDSFQLMTSGDEPAAADEPMHRAVSGGTDIMRTMKGEETIVFRGKNETGARNYTLCYTLDNILDIALFNKETPRPPVVVNLFISPNPSSGIVDVTIDNASIGSKGILRMFDMSGRLIWQQELWLDSGVTRVTKNLDFLPQGMYRMQLMHGDISVEKPLLFHR